MRSKLALAALMIFAIFAMGAEVGNQKMVRQTGGSTGDSCTAAADTSDTILLKTNLTGVQVVVACDSLTIYTTQVSADGGTHWHTIDVDTVAIGSIEATADFGTAYNGMQIRVIQDAAFAADYGRAYLKPAR
jgi:hypothetical protein